MPNSIRRQVQEYISFFFSSPPFPSLISFPFLSFFFPPFIDCLLPSIHPSIHPSIRPSFLHSFCFGISVKCNSKWRYVLSGSKKVPKNIVCPTIGSPLRSSPRTVSLAERKNSSGSLTVSSATEGPPLLLIVVKYLASVSMFSFFRLFYSVKYKFHISLFSHSVVFSFLGVFLCFRHLTPSSVNSLIASFVAMKVC